ncbi:MAG TPA: hypothetical protein VFU35_02720, partial [Jatrophihabitans sp.]|nr:hypothetical protein [Jatrophihabitans sp.]
MNIDEHMLKILDTRVGLDQPMTMNDFARRFGISKAVVRPAAVRLVDAGLAVPSTVLVDGVPTLQGLL